jgi:hypothetical protein
MPILMLNLILHSQDARREVIAKMERKPRPLSLKADSVESMVVTDGQQLTAAVKGNISLSIYFVLTFF